jgi:hypothetical protein
VAARKNRLITIRKNRSERTILQRFLVAARKSCLRALNKRGTSLYDTPIKSSSKRVTGMRLSSPTKPIKSMPSPMAPMPSITENEISSAILSKSIFNKRQATRPVQKAIPVIASTSDRSNTLSTVDKNPTYSSGIFMALT